MAVVEEMLAFIVAMMFIYMGYLEIKELESQKELLRKARRYQAQEIRINIATHVLRGVMYFTIAIVVALVVR